MSTVTLDDAVAPDVERAELLVYNLPIEAEGSYTLIENILLALTTARFEERERIREAIRRAPCAYYDAVLAAIDPPPPAEK